MIQAYNDDQKAIKEGKPGLNKLLMLSNVNNELMKYLQISFAITVFMFTCNSLSKKKKKNSKARQGDFVVSGICDVLAEWLAPVKTVLPNLTLRITLLRICNDVWLNKRQHN